MLDSLAIATKILKAELLESLPPCREGMYIVILAG